MKFIKFFSFLLLFAMAALTSCNKDEINTTDVVPDPVDPKETFTNGLITRSVTGDDALELGCMTIEYPFTLLLLDSTTVTVNTEDDFINAISDSTNYPIDFVYPLVVTLEDGTTQTVNNADELGALFANCIPDTGWEGDSLDYYFPAWDINFDNSCFQLVYPVTLIGIDSSTVTAANHDELIAYLADGHLYSFSFPISLEGQDGTATLVTGGEDLFDLLASCNPGGGGGGGCTIGGFACYQFAYPINLINLDGSTVTVNNDDEFAVATMSGEWVGFQYPITLIAEDSTEIIVNNDDELNEALLNCGIIIGGDPTTVWGDFMCYNFEFPIQVIDFNGTTVTVDDQAEWMSLLQNGFGLTGFVFPINLTHAETGATVTVDNDQELEEAFEECF